MSKANLRVRVALLENGITQNELAEEIGIHFTSMSAILRHELSESEQDRLVSKIHEIRERKGA